MFSQIKYALGALFTKRTTPVTTPNTFFVWEPCSHSHAEVVPGFAKYLLDLGFEVSVLVTPKRLDEGLFSRFTHERMTVNRMSQPAIVHYFKKHGLSGAKGVLITTARKIGAKSSYKTERNLFTQRAARQNVLLVEHDVKQPADHGAVDRNIITLKEIRYKDIRTTVVNPHYFGNINITPKSAGIVKFITVGALRARRRNTTILIDAVASLHSQGIDNFTVTVIGRGDLRGVPAELRRYFDIKGRVDFSQLYSELEQADFFLALLDPDNPSHERYLTTGASGNFQLIYGFAKPCLIAVKFAAAYGFNHRNSIVYTDNAGLAASMLDAINMPQSDYQAKQDAVQELAASIHAHSLDNLRRLIDEGSP